jgi:site-specific recombinase XerD
MKKITYLSYYIRIFLTQFLAYERGLSENTILAYRDCLKLFLYFCEDNLKIDIDKISCEDIDNHVVIDFLDWLENNRKCSPRTRNARLAALKSFFYYLGRNIPEYLDNVRKIMSISQKKIPHKTVDYLEEDEFAQILNCINSLSPNGLRDKALLLLMYNTGARVTEIINITIDDLRLDKSAQVNILGKGKKYRVSPLWEETVKALKAYMAIRKSKNKKIKRLFLNANGFEITRFGVRYIIQKYSNKAMKITPTLKNKTTTPHIIRHTTAMHLLQAGNELNMIRLWLGHSSLDTTHMYVELDMKMKKEILNKCQPPILKEKKKLWKQPKILEWLESFSQNKTVRLC